MEYWYIVHSLGPTLYWATVLLITILSLCCAAFVLRVPNRFVLGASALALAIALVLVAIPAPHPSLLFQVLLGIAALALAVVGGGPAVLTVLALATRGSTVPGSYGGIVVVDDPARGGTPRPGERTEVLRGGMTIGLVERLAVAGAIVAGFPSAIAVVVAVKSVGRFSELNVAESRERFIIGTLVSLLWACACAALVHFALR